MSNTRRHHVNIDLSEIDDRYVRDQLVDYLLDRVSDTTGYLVQSLDCTLRVECVLDTSDEDDMSVGNFVDAVFYSEDFNRAEEE